MIKIILNGRQVEVEEGITVLEAARNESIYIPTLCYHKALKPYGGCKLCIVESEGPNLRKMMRPSCILKVSEGLVVETESLRIAAMRKDLLSLYISLAPHPRQFLTDLARKYGAEKITPEAGAEFCSRCTLCVRVCREKIGASALSLAKSESAGPSRAIRYIREACYGGGTCASICPSGILRMEDRGAERTMVIRGREVGTFELAKCEECGSHYVTPEYLDKVQSRLSAEEGKIIRKICPECARRHFTVALTGRFICGEQ
jgi:bidirectional [NiFe] hydrogenase diaphorase subunit